MSKEQKALLGLENRINWALFKLEFRASDAERQKRRVLKAHKQIQIIKEALNELEDAKHNYNALKEFYDNAVAYATKLQIELNELKKQKEKE